MSWTGIWPSVSLNWHFCVYGWEIFGSKSKYKHKKCICYNLVIEEMGKENAIFVHCTKNSSYASLQCCTLKVLIICRWRCHSRMISRSSHWWECLRICSFSLVWSHHDGTKSQISRWCHWCQILSLPCRDWDIVFLLIWIGLICPTASTSKNRNVAVIGRTKLEWLEHSH